MQRTTLAIGLMVMLALAGPVWAQASQPISSPTVEGPASTAVTTTTDRTATQTCPPGHTCVITSDRNRVMVLPPRAQTRNRAAAQPRPQVVPKRTDRYPYPAAPAYAQPHQDGGITIICHTCYVRQHGSWW